MAPSSYPTSSSVGSLHAQPDLGPLDRKRSAMTANSKLHTPSETEYSPASPKQKRPRTNSYHPPNTQVPPISKKRRATSQDLDEELPTTQSNSTSYISLKKKTKRSRTDVDYAFVSSPQRKAVVSTQGPQEAEADILAKERHCEPYKTDYHEPDTEEDEPEIQENDNGATNEGKGEPQIPADPPVEAFAVQPLAKLSSWTKGRHAPTQPYVNQLDCPINWDSVKGHFKGLTDAHIQAYIFRKPWTVRGEEVDYESIIVKFQEVGDNSVKTLEGARKRFGKANLAVFETTGVWFESSAAGLEKYAIKGRTRNDLQQQHAQQNNTAANYYEHSDGPPLPVEVELQTGEHIIMFILQPPDLGPNDRCLECCQYELCYDQDCREAWRTFRIDSGPGKSSNSAISNTEDEDEPYHIGEHSSDRWAKALAKQCTPFGCHVHQPLTRRFIHLEKFEDVRTSKSPVEDFYLVDVSPKAFDLFASCFAPQFSGKFPQQPKRLMVYLDKEDGDMGKEYSKAIYENVGYYTVGDILEAYCCSQSLKCPIVSDVLLKHLRDILLERESLKLFLPEDLQYVFHYTNASDPIRLFLLDAFRLKMIHAKGMMRQYREAYPPELVRYWDHWERQQDDEISPDEQKPSSVLFAETYQGRRGITNGLVGIIRAVSRPEDDNEQDEDVELDFQEQEGVIWGNCVFKGWSSRTWKPATGRLSREALHERFMQSDSVDALSSNNDKMFWETYRNQPDRVY